MTARTKPASPPDDLAAARRVLEMEGEGIARFAASLGQAFTDALDRLAAVTGRVVVTGIGKSGHIAHKIAATLASTGTPALFVHPAEASHGDLGMITPKDAVLAFSNSGETPELADLIAYTRRFTIPLIAVTGRPKSALAEAADVTLLLPAAPEACPLGLAPTTSTTVMLALGDALAVALLERKGFTADEFQVLHPGGQLGRNLLRVSDVMHTGGEIPLVDAKASMSDVLIVMTTKSFGCIGILQDDSRLAGVITDGDLRRHMDGLLEKKAEDVMTGNPKTIRPNALAAEALGYMNANKITSLFVVEDTRPVGILHIHDCLRAGVA
ncbi:MAG: KpsF/GutQ family sugar-phosphate isomerase [Alphaproteobacteria bacterium]|nr:KpsF/GutQ family sugar-phosphate isomerase [Alphaproteobacteria bacterium]